MRHHRGNRLYHKVHVFVLITRYLHHHNYGSDLQVLHQDLLHLQSLSNRNALEEPMFPTIQSPVDMPMPTFMGGRFKGLSSSLSCFVASIISIADITALELRSSQSKGAFQNAIIQSPMYLSIVPSFFKIIFVCTSRNLFISCTNPSGSSLFLYFSLIGRNPRCP